jgi:HEAT repeat protein
MKRLRSLDNVATDEAIRELAETLGDPRGALRYLAGTALRRIGGRQVVEKLARTLEKGEPSPTLMEEGKKVLVVMAETDPDSSARQHASALLSRLLRLEQPGPKSGEEENR